MRLFSFRMWYGRDLVPKCARQGADFSRGEAPSGPVWGEILCLVWWGTHLAWPWGPAVASGACAALVLAGAEGKRCVEDDARKVRARLGEITFTVQMCLLQRSHQIESFILASKDFFSDGLWSSSGCSEEKPPVGALRRILFESLKGERNLWNVIIIGLMLSLLSIHFAQAIFYSFREKHTVTSSLCYSRSI